MKQDSKVAHTRCMSLLQKGEENKMCKSYMMIPINMFLYSGSCARVSTCLILRSMNAFILISAELKQFFLPMTNNVQNIPCG